MSKPEFSVAAIVRMMLAARPSKVDAASIRNALGDTAVSSAAALSKLFGVSYTTIKTSWRPSGMPGGPQCYVVADVLIWRLTRDMENSESAAADEISARRRAAEAAAAESDAALKQLRLERARGDFVPTALVQSDLATCLSLSRDAVMRWPDQFRPLFPPKIADAMVGEVDRKCRLVLNALADRLEQLCERSEQTEGSENEQSEI